MNLAFVSNLQLRGSIAQVNIWVLTGCEGDDIFPTERSGPIESLDIRHSDELCLDQLWLDMVLRHEKARNAGGWVMDARNAHIVNVGDFIASALRYLQEQCKRNLQQDEREMNIKR